MVGVDSERLKANLPQASRQDEEGDAARSTGRSVEQLSKSSGRFLEDDAVLVLDQYILHATVAGVI